MSFRSAIKGLLKGDASPSSFSAAVPPRFMVLNVESTDVKSASENCQSTRVDWLFLMCLSVLDSIKSSVYSWRVCQSASPYCRSNQLNVNLISSLAPPKKLRKQGTSPKANEERRSLLKIHVSIELLSSHCQSLDPLAGWHMGTSTAAGTPSARGKVTDTLPRKLETAPLAKGT